MRFRGILAFPVVVLACIGSGSVATRPSDGSDSSPVFSEISTAKVLRRLRSNLPPQGEDWREDLEISATRSVGGLLAESLGVSWPKELRIERREVRVDLSVEPGFTVAGATASFVLDEVERGMGTLTIVFKQTNGRVSVGSATLWIRPKRTEVTGSVRDPTKLPPPPSHPNFVCEIARHHLRRLVFDEGAICPDRGGTPPSEPTYADAYKSLDELGKGCFCPRQDSIKNTYWSLHRFRDQEDLYCQLAYSSDGRIEAVFSGYCGYRYDVASGRITSASAHFPAEEPGN